MTKQNYTAKELIGLTAIGLLAYFVIAPLFQAAVFAALNFILGKHVPL